jgi:Icc-related predicted phosphoesterase
LCVTGHIHEAQGRDTIGDTVVVNPGMLSAGGWVTITVNEAELDISLS